MDPARIHEPLGGTLVALLRGGPRQVVLLSVLCHQVGRMRLVQVALLSLLGQLFSVWQTSRVDQKIPLVVVLR